MAAGHCCHSLPFLAPDFWMRLLNLIALPSLILQSAICFVNRRLSAPMLSSLEFILYRNTPSLLQWGTIPLVKTLTQFICLNIASHFLDYQKYLRHDVNLDAGPGFAALKFFLLFLFKGSVLSLLPHQTAALPAAESLLPVLPLYHANVCICKNPVCVVCWRVTESLHCFCFISIRGCVFLLSQHPWMNV